MLSAVERVQTLVDGRRLAGLPMDELLVLGDEAKRRWRALRLDYELPLEFAGDAVALIDPEFRLPSDVEERIQHGLPWAYRRITVRYLKWEMCPTTQGAENPLEPLIEILEHGGGFHIDHGTFLDIYDTDGAACSVVLVG